MTHSTRSCALLFIIALVFAGAESAAQPSVRDFERYCEKVRSDWELPGMALAVVRGESVLVSRGFGVRTTGTRDSVNEHTLFAIASLSKAFTSASLGKLVDQGRVRWDEPVRTYLPWFEMADPYVSREITVRDLLSHRSGLHTFGGDLVWYGTTYSREEVLRRIRHLRPRHGFRAAYGYQNVMFLAAGEILPAVTGRPWEEFVHDSIFVPLGMMESCTSTRDLEGKSNVATPHVTVRGAPQAIPYRAVDNVGPAAAINSSVHDLARWLQMWLREEGDPGVRVVSAAVRNDVWSATTPLRLSPRSLQRFPSRHFYAYGLGWFMMDYRGRKVLLHDGAMDGMISTLCLIPEEKLGMVILTNCSDSPVTPLLYRFLDSFLGGGERDWSAEWLTGRKQQEEHERVEEAKTDAARVRGTRLSLPLASYAGTYRSALYGDVVAEVQGERLVLRFVPTPTFVADLTHWHYDTFRVQMRDPALTPRGFATFVLDADGKPDQLKIDIPNPDFDFSELELHRVEGRP